MYVYVLHVRASELCGPCGSDGPPATKHWGRCRLLWVRTSIPLFSTAFRSVDTGPDPAWLPSPGCASPQLTCLASAPSEPFCQLLLLHTFPTRRRALCLGADLKYPVFTRSLFPPPVPRPPNHPLSPPRFPSPRCPFTPTPTSVSLGQERTRRPTPSSRLHMIPQRHHLRCTSPRLSILSSLMVPMSLITFK